MPQPSPAARAPETADQTESICAVCSHEGSKRCISCGQANYCSKKCQRNDWNTHKLLCASMKDFLTAPVEDVKRAIFFPADEDAPRFVWVRCPWNPDDGYETAHTGGLLDPDAAPSHVLTWPENELRNRPFQHVIQFVSRDAFLTDGSVKNRSLGKATGGTLPYDWRGPIIALARKGKSPTLTSYDDVTMHDFRDIVDFFSIYDGTLNRNSNIRKMRVVVGKTKGVRINCSGHMKDFGGKEYVGVEVELGDPIFMEPSLKYDVPRMLRLPVCILRYPPEEAWSSTRSKFENPAATHLQALVHGNAAITRDANGKAQFGGPPAMWVHKGGSALVVRSLGEELLPEQLEVLCEFCVGEVWMACMQAERTGNVEQGKRMIEEKITKANFLTYFDLYCSMRAKTDERWRNVPSPYDMLPPSLAGMEAIRSASVPLLPGIAGSTVRPGRVEMRIRVAG